MIILLALAAALLASPIDGNHAIAVALRDQAGRGVVGIAVVVRNESGARELAAATTGADGRAELSVAEGGAVRVAIAGALADGTPLTQRGLDARGIWLLLDAPRVALDLRVEPGGAVVPDPAMVSPDLPDSPRATPAGQVTPTVAPASPTSTLAPAGNPATPGGGRALGALALGLALALGALAVWRRGGARWSA